MCYGCVFFSFSCWFERSGIFDPPLAHIFSLCSWPLVFVLLFFLTALRACMQPLKRMIFLFFSTLNLFSFYTGSICEDVQGVSFICIFKRAFFPFFFPLSFDTTASIRSPYSPQPIIPFFRFFLFLISFSLLLPIPIVGRERARGTFKIFDSLPFSPPNFLKHLSCWMKERRKAGKARHGGGNESGFQDILRKKK